MIIKHIDFPIYSIVILVSLIVCLSFNYFYLTKNNIEKRYIYLSMLMNIAFCILGAKLLNIYTHSNANIINAGLSSYGGAIGIIIGSIIFSKMINDKKIIESYIISLPLTYSIAKLACFFAGCCYGIPYKGPFSVTYPAGLNIPLFPIQLLETITFLIVFALCLKKKNNKIGFTIIISSITKFLLDFLRYSHIKQIISLNQYISIGLVIITLIYIIYNNKRYPLSNVIKK